MARPEREIIELSKIRAEKISFDRSQFGKKFKRPSILLKTKIAVIARDKLTCVQCGAILKIKFISQKNLSIKNGVFHHIIPLIYGGPNILENICLLCKPCHTEVHSGREIKEKYYEMFECFILTKNLWCK